MSEVTQVLKELSDQKGGIKDKTKLPRFFQLVQKEQELRGRVQITASIKSSSSSIHRELLNQGILSFLEAWLSDAVQKKKFDFAKMLVGVLNQLPVGLEDLRQANIAKMLINFRKSENQGLAQDSKKLIEKWKLFVKTNSNGATKKQEFTEIAGLKHRREEDGKLEEVGVQNKRLKMGSDEVSNVANQSQPVSGIAASPLDNFLVNPIAQNKTENQIGSQKQAFTKTSNILKDTKATVNSKLLNDSKSGAKGLSSDSPQQPVTPTQTIPKRADDKDSSEQLDTSKPTIVQQSACALPREFIVGSVGFDGSFGGKQSCNFSALSTLQGQQKTRGYGILNQNGAIGMLQQQKKQYKQPNSGQMVPVQKASSGRVEKAISLDEKDCAMLDVPRKSVKWAGQKHIESVRFFRAMDPATAVKSNPECQEVLEHIHNEKFDDSVKQEHVNEMQAQRQSQLLLTSLERMQSQIYFLPPLQLVPPDDTNWSVGQGSESQEKLAQVREKLTQVQYETIKEIPDTPQSPTPLENPPELYSPRIIPWSDPHQQAALEHEMQQQQIMSEAVGNQQPTAFSNQESSGDTQPVLILKEDGAQFELTGSNISLNHLVGQNIGYVSQFQQQVPIVVSNPPAMVKLAGSIDGESDDNQQKDGQEFPPSRDWGRGGEDRDRGRVDAELDRDREWDQYRRSAWDDVGIDNPYRPYHEYEDYERYDGYFSDRSYRSYLKAGSGSGSSGRERRVCRYYNSTVGCRNGDKCPYLHIRD